MGIPYETFLVIFTLGITTGYLGAMVKRRTSGSLEARAIENLSPLRGLWITLEMASVIAWFALILLGFMSLRWYVAAGIFVGVGLLAGFAGGVVLFRRDMDSLTWIGRVTAAATVAICLFLWVQRFSH